MQWPGTDEESVPDHASPLKIKDSYIKIIIIIIINDYKIRNFVIIVTMRLSGVVV